MPPSRERRTAEETKTLGRKSPVAKAVMKAQKVLRSCETLMESGLWRMPTPCNQRRKDSTKCLKCQKLMKKVATLIRKTIERNSEIEKYAPVDPHDGNFRIWRHRKRGG